jgi:hypothetical protein
LAIPVDVPSAGGGLLLAFTLSRFENAGTVNIADWVGKGSILVGAGFVE